MDDVSHSPDSLPPSDPPRLTARIAADPGAAARARREFGSWLRSNYLLDDERLNDLLLAVYEALVNAAEFAYLDGTGSRGVELDALYAPDADTLTVTVADQGCWRPPDSTTNFRGRGIPLMRALSDEMTIDSTNQGTVVTLVWANIATSDSA